MKNPEPFLNRIRKNKKHWSKWARKNDIEAFRVYDKDIPEFPLSVDFYGSALVVYGYEKKRTDSPLLEGIEELQIPLARMFEIPGGRVFFKIRRQKTERQQYEKLSTDSAVDLIHEKGLQFEVNFSDYLDTGIFLDHRITRQMVGDLAKGQKVLNLFCYTATASVYAAISGAKQVTSVDLSNTYLEWGKRNFLQNDINPDQHRFIKADTKRFLGEAIEKNEKYEIIFVDPPSFSNSKSMNGIWDVQKHHVPLLRDCAKVLAKDGVILFSNNLRTFQIEGKGLPNLKIEEITQKTLPPDYRNKKIHKTFKLTF